MFHLENRLLREEILRIKKMKNNTIKKLEERKGQRQ